MPGAGRGPSRMCHVHRWDRLLVVVALCVGTLGSCSQQVFEPVRDGLVATASLDGDVRVVTRADLLFVIDDSASMLNEQAKLAAGFPALLDRLEALDPPVDWRVGVMTTTVTERFGPCDSGDPTAPAACAAEFGGTGFVCEDNACVRRWPDRAGKLVAAPGNPLILERSRMSAADLAARFAENVRVGLDGSRHEQPLRAVELALENGTLAEFTRPDARLVILIASDEDDCSDSADRLLALEATSSGWLDHCDEQARGDGSRLDSIDAWVERLSSGVPGGARDVAIGAIVGLGSGSKDPGMCVDEACANECRSPGHRSSCEAECQGALQFGRCVSECIEECAIFCGSQAPGRRLSRAVRAMSGPVASICESDFGPVLANLARVIGIPERIELPSTPGDSRAFFFTVERNGRTIRCEEGRDYVIDRSSTPAAMDIVQSGACRLIPDDHWSIRYVAQ